MWYTVESDKSTIRNEGGLACKSAYKNLREMFRLPSFDSLNLGLAGDLSTLIAWTEDTRVKVMPFVFEKDKRVKIDLVSKTGSEVVGSVWYGKSETLSATFSNTSDAIDILSMFYQHSLVLYGDHGSEYRTVSIREIIEST